MAEHKRMFPWSPIRSKTDGKIVPGFLSPPPCWISAENQTVSNFHRVIIRFSPAYVQLSAAG